MLLNGQTAYSCSTLTHRVRNTDVLTIEGVKGADGGLHPVQQAFIDELGTVWFLYARPSYGCSFTIRNPNPSVDEARILCPATFVGVGPTIIICAAS